MNDIESVSFGTFLWRILRSPYIKTKWFLSRTWIAIKLICIIFRARSIELKLQEKKQEMFDLRQNGNTENSWKAQGFCEALEWCLSKGWNKYG